MLLLGLCLLIVLMAVGLEKVIHIGKGDVQLTGMTDHIYRAVPEDDVCAVILKKHINYSIRRLSIAEFHYKNP